jgi:RNA polymerase-interacting CarD/CdnL/TRCF family regulator
MVYKIFLACLALACFGGCSKEHVAKGEGVTYDVRDHKLQSKTLKQLMLSLDVSISNNYKSELEKEDTRVRYALRLSSDVQKVAVRLKEMAHEDFNKRLSDEDRRIYNESVARLENCAHAIEKVAKNYEVEQLESKIANLKQSCVTCHSHFGVAYGR